MDSRDEELTLENVDEQVARVLEQLQTSQSAIGTSLDRAMRNLQLIYEEKSRVERVWERLNQHAATFDLPAPQENSASGASVPVQPLRLPGKVERDGTGLLAEHLSRPLSRIEAGQRPRKLRQRRNLGMSLVAALVLITLFAIIFAWPVLSLRFHGAQTGSGKTPGVNSVSPQSTPTMQMYTGEYFKIQYPTDWKVAGITEESTASYLQTVQFRPLTASPVEVNVSAMPDNQRSIAQLLAIDPRVKLGTLESTRTVSYHGVTWEVGVVNLVSSSPTQASKLEIAYARQTTLYRIELGATPATFERSTAIFDAMLASFYPRVVPAATATSGSSPTATPSPGATAATMKVYIGQYFTFEYPANWVITSDTTGGTARQMIQLRPSASSQIFVNIDAMYTNSLSGSQLLNIDPDVNLGVLLSTSTVSYHTISWSVGIVQLTSALLQSSKLEIAYSNQHAPYKLEFSAPVSAFTAYKPIFTSIFSSFSPVS